jgi:acetyl-CoA acetyltransferase
VQVSWVAYAVTGATAEECKVSWVISVGLTPYGRLEGRSTLDLMSEAASSALTDAGLERRDIEGVICGYSTTMPHIML